MRFVTIATDGSGSSPYALVSAVANQRIKVWGLSLNVTATNSFTIQSGTTGTMHIGDEDNATDHLQMLVNNQFRLNIRRDKPWFQCDVNADMNLNVEGAGEFAGLVAYTIDEVDMEAL